MYYSIRFDNMATFSDNIESHVCSELIIRHQWDTQFNRSVGALLDLIARIIDEWIITLSRLILPCRRHLHRGFNLNINHYHFNCIGTRDNVSRYTALKMAFLYETLVLTFRWPLPWFVVVKSTNIDTNWWLIR